MNTDLKPNRETIGVHLCSSAVVPRAIYRSVANLLDYSISVCDNQHIEHYELVTFAIEAVANAASH